MAPAIVHFTVGFSIVLVVVWLVPLTRYRLTAAYLGGIWGVAPDFHHLLSGERADRVYAIHNSETANVFMFHHTLDKPEYRELSIELTFIAFGVLGALLILHDWRFGTSSPVSRFVDSTETEQPD